MAVTEAKRKSSVLLTSSPTPSFRTSCPKKNRRTVKMLKMKVDPENVRRKAKGIARHYVRRNVGHICPVDADFQLKIPYWTMNGAQPEQC